MPGGAKGRMEKQMVVVYIKLERSVEVEEETVHLSDVAFVECQDRSIQDMAEKLCIYKFKEGAQKRTVISVLRIIQILEKELKRESSQKTVLIQSVGEKDVFIQQVKQAEKKRPPNIGKIIMVCLVAFCGSAFTIMAYHNDIEIHKLFEGTVRFIMPQNLNLGLLIIESAYSVGLATGIIVFFNHVGKRKLSNDPTPIEVALRKYELDVDMTLIENADREGVEVEVK